MEISKEEESNNLDSAGRQKEPEKQPESDSKAEGIANDLMNAIEPIIRVTEKATGRDRSDFMGKLVMGAVKGKIGDAFGSAFGDDRKKTRIEKFKDAFQIAIWLLMLVMWFFWVNYGIARFLGVI